MLYRGYADHDSSQVWLHFLQFSFCTYQCIPNVLTGRRCVVIGHCKEWTVPSCHAIWLFVAIDKVFEYVIWITSILFWVTQKFRIDFFAFIDRRSYMDLAVS